VPSSLISILSKPLWTKDFPFKALKIVVFTFVSSFRKGSNNTMEYLKILELTTFPTDIN
jgi:hypothetical protein